MDETDSKQQKTCEETTEIKCSFHCDESVRLFCTECEETVCIKCLLESHQQHRVVAISEGLPLIKEKVLRWVSENKEETKQNLKVLKQDIITKFDKSMLLEAEAEDNIRNCDCLWRTKIENTANDLSKTAKETFQKSRESGSSLLGMVEFCEKEIDNIDLNSEIKLLKFYSNMKQCTDKEGDLPSCIDMEFPSLKLNFPKDDFCIGHIDRPFDQLVSNSVETKQTCDFVAQTYYGNDLSSVNFPVEETKERSLVHCISLGTFKLSVSKVLPISRTDAWLISNRKLFKLTIAGIEQYTAADEADDIAILQNGDLLILNRSKSFIYQLDKNGILTSFTSTDPYIPLCMDFIDKENMLMVWMCDKETRQMTQFSSTGEKKKSFSLPNSNFECSFMSAHSTNNFSIIYEVTQATGGRNYVYSYSLEPKANNSFSGRFGQSPYLQFICKGLCYDKEGNVLASDMQFNSVYKLDGKLQFQKMVLDKYSGLKSPTALGFKDGFLWVSDASHLKIYNYDLLK